MTEELKTFADECEELGKFRKEYMSLHNLRVLSMGKACQLWREHQGDIEAKDKLIVESVNNAARYKKALEKARSELSDLQYICRTSEPPYRWIENKAHKMWRDVAKALNIKED